MAFLRQPSSGPKLVSTVLPAYEVPELIVMGGVIVENRGGATAHNVKIGLEYEQASADRIRHLQVFSDADYILRGGGEHASFATLRLRELRAGERIFIYFSGPTRIQPRVTVTTYEA